MERFNFNVYHIIMYLYFKAKLNSKQCIFTSPSENFRKMALAYEMLWFITMEFSQRKKSYWKKCLMSDPFLVIMWGLNEYSPWYCYFSWKEKHKEETCESDTHCTYRHNPPQANGTCRAVKKFRACKSCLS